MSGTVFSGIFFPSSTNSRRASCQLLAKEWTLNTGKVPPRGLLRNSVVKYLTSAVYCGHKATNQTNKYSKRVFAVSGWSVCS